MNGQHARRRGFSEADTPSVGSLSNLYYVTATTTHHHIHNARTCQVKSSLLDSAKAHIH